VSTPTPIYTNAEMWQLTRATIAALMTSGQTVSYQGRSLTMANLGELRKAETDYKALMDLDLAARPGRSRVAYIIPV
jgi:hypothetical protein